MIRPLASKQQNSPRTPRTPRSKRDAAASLFNNKRAITPELLFDKADLFATDISDDCIIFGNGIGMIEVLSRQTNERTKTLNYAPSRGENVMCAKFCGDSRLLAADTLGNIVMYDTSTRTNDTTTVSPMAILDKDEKIGKSQVSVNGLDWNGFQTAAAVLSDKSIRLYDTTSNYLTNKVCQSIDIGDGTSSLYLGHTKQPHCVKFIDSEIFVTSGWDDCLKLWDRRAPQTAAISINGVHVCGPSIDVQPGSDNKILAVGSWRAENGLQLWDLRKAGNNSDKNAQNSVSRSFQLSKAKELDHNGDYIYTAKFLNKKTLLAGGSGSAKLLAVDVETGEIIDKMSFQGRTIQSISVAHDIISVAGVKGACKIIQV